MHKSSGGYSKVVQKLCRRRSKVMQKSFKGYSKVAQQLCTTRPRDMQKSSKRFQTSSRSYAKIVRKFFEARPKHMQLTSAAWGAPMGHGKYIHATGRAPPCTTGATSKYELIYKQSPVQARCALRAAWGSGGWSSDPDEGCQGGPRG